MGYVYDFTTNDINNISNYVKNNAIAVHMKVTSDGNTKIYNMRTNILKDLIEITNNAYNRLNSKNASVSLVILDKVNQELVEVFRMEGKKASVPSNLVKNKGKSAKDFSQVALTYAERYGIITYKVVGHFMTYNQNYTESEFIGGKWTRKAKTVQRKVDLTTGEVESTVLKRLQKNGWDNV